MYEVPKDLKKINILNIIVLIIAIIVYTIGITDKSLYQQPAIAWLLAVMSVISPISYSISIAVSFAYSLSIYPFKFQKLNTKKEKWLLSLALIALWLFLPYVSGVIFILALLWQTCWWGYYVRFERKPFPPATPMFLGFVPFLLFSLTSKLDPWSTFIKLLGKS